MDWDIYCYFPKGYKQKGFVLQIKKTLYGLRKSPKLWLQKLLQIFTDFELSQIPGEPYLFTDYREIIIFFFINYIASMFTVAQKRDLEDLINKLK